MTDRTSIQFKKPSRREQRRDRIPALIVLEGAHIGETYFLRETSTVIGRSDTAQISLHEEGVSRQHARIDLHESTYAIVDLGSTNGTYVNGEPIEQTALHEGDKVRVGDVLLRFGYQDMVDVNYQETLRNMAMRDGLTKTYNRSYFVETLEREITFSARKRQSLSCLLIDIDHFKAINDTHGHHAGDSVLRQLAQAIENEVRGYDLVARYGGEEFAVLLRGTALENALLFAERMRRMVEASSFEYEDAKMSVTISVGVAALDPDRPCSSEDLLKQADRHLYAAKAAGRNRVASTRSN